jgi:hypothetical protein
LTAINVQVSDSTLSINQVAKNIVRNQVAPSSRVSSAQDDPDNCFNKLQFRWKMLHNHQDTDLYWFFQDHPASVDTNSGIITKWMLFLLVELDNPTPPGVKWKEVSRLSAPLHRRLYADVFRSSLLLRPPVYSLQSSSSVTRSPPTVVSSSIDLSDALEGFLELDVWRHRSPLEQLPVVLINN